VPEPFTFKRHKPVSEDQLTRQLREVPEVTLDTPAHPTSPARMLAARSHRVAFDHPVLEPLTQRTDLHGLPVRLGSECQLGKEAADQLQVLSRKLRQYVTQALPGDSIDNRPDARKLRSSLLPGRADERNEWLEAEAVPTLVQMLQAERKALRLLLIELLAANPRRAATIALAQRALFDTSDEVREEALRALFERPRADYRQVLLDGLRYQWAAVADHAAEALASLNDRATIPQLVQLLDEPDPNAPQVQKFQTVALDTLRRSEARTDERQASPFAGKALLALEETHNGSRTTRFMGIGSTPGWPSKDSRLVVRELVRVNHLRNCMLCHAPATSTNDPVRGLVPEPGQPLPPPTTPYYGGDRGIFVRADITYLKQDFAVPQPVAKAEPWPAFQRYDYLVRIRTRYLGEEDLLQWFGAKKSDSYPQREAVLFALRELTGRDLGESASAWRRMLARKE
jgi:hypothetical protein